MSTPFAVLSALVRADKTELEQYDFDPAEVTTAARLTAVRTLAKHCRLPKPLGFEKNGRWQTVFDEPQLQNRLTEDEVIFLLDVAARCLRAAH